jgi:hypothetical protein
VREGRCRSDWHERGETKANSRKVGVAAVDNVDVMMDVAWLHRKAASCGEGESIKKDNKKNREGEKADEVGGQVF